MYFSQPFVPPERPLFWQSWLTVLLSALATAAVTGYIGVGFVPCAATVALGFALFQRWVTRLPTFLEWLQEQRVVPTQREAFRSMVAAHEPQGALRLRLLLTLPTVLLALNVAFDWYGPNLRGICFGMCLALWVWMSATVACVQIQFVRLLRALAQRDMLQVVPEHPDRCSGLSPIGGFMAFMVAPLMLGSLLLALLAVNPQVSATTWSWAARTLCYEESQCGWLYEAVVEGRRRAKHASLLEQRIKAIDKQCADPQLSPQAFETCLETVLRLDAERARLARGRKPLAYELLPFARTALLVVLTAFVVLLSPVWELHLALLRHREQVLQKHTQLLDIVQQKLQQEVRSGTAALEDRLLAFHNARRAIVGQHFPLWPLDLPTVLRTATPPALAIASTVLRDLGFW